MNTESALASDTDHSPTQAEIIQPPSTASDVVPAQVDTSLQTESLEPNLDILNPDLNRSMSPDEREKAYARLPPDHVSENHTRQEWDTLNPTLGLPEFIPDTAKDPGTGTVFFPRTGQFITGVIPQTELKGRIQLNDTWITIPRRFLETYLDAGRLPYLTNSPNRLPQ